MLELKQISRTYGSGAGAVSALKDVTLNVDRGEFIALTGPSGSGKSTLLNVIGGLDRATGGQVILDGQRLDNLSEDAMVSIRRSQIAHIFQQYHLLPSLSALENVLLPLIFSGAADDTARAREMLDKVGLASRADHKPSELSGGEQQRVAIARALAGNPSLILADEPTGNLDQDTGREVMAIFDSLHQEGHTIIMVTHDLAVARHSGRVVTIRDGQITNPGSAETGMDAKITNSN
jgi:putative ABC transport system ATP-binding protein